MVGLRTIISKLIKGYRKTAVFAVTTRCNARCAMCDMWRRKPESIGLDEAKGVIDFLVDRNFLVVYFTGGEPTLHSDIAKMVSYADEQGLVTSLTTNGTVPPRTLEKLADGLYNISVSVDHFNAKVWDEIKGIDGVPEKAIKTIQLSKELGLKTYGLTFLGPDLTKSDCIEEMIEYVNERLGVPFAFCYPVKTDENNENTYSLGGELSDYPNRDVVNIKRTVEKMLILKKKHKIANPATYLEDVIKFHEGQPPNCYCKGGEDVVYIDWSGNVYPCFMKGKLFNVLDDKNARLLKGVYCNDCLTNCFREPSILAQSSLGLALKELTNNPCMSIYI